MLEITDEVKLLINKLLSLKLGSFINNIDELILIPEINLYFKLKSTDTAQDFKCKVLEWCSRNAIKGVDKYWQDKVQDLINFLLDTNFTYNDLDKIYCNLGNAVNHQLTIEFINSNYNFKVLCKGCVSHCRQLENKIKFN